VRVGSRGTAPTTGNTGGNAQSEVSFGINRFNSGSNVNSWGNGNPTNAIAELRVYSRELSDRDVLALYDQSTRWALYGSVARHGFISPPSSPLAVSSRSIPAMSDPLFNGLEMYYPLRDSQAELLTGHDLNMTGIARPNITVGARSLYTNAAVDAGATAPTAMGTTASRPAREVFTVCGWVYHEALDGGAERAIVMAAQDYDNATSPPGQRGHMLGVLCNYNADTRFWFYTNGGSNPPTGGTRNAYGTRTVTAGKWYFVAGIRKGSQGLLYSGALGDRRVSYDGGSNSWEAPIAQNMPWQIGARSYPNFAGQTNACYSKWGWWTRALNETDLQQLFMEGPG